MKRIKMPKRFWDDEEWALERMGKLQKKYKEKWVAIVDRRVVGVAEDPGIARKVAKEKTGKKHIPVIFIESGESLY